MDVPIVISVGSTPSRRQIIYLKPKETKSSKQVPESDKNSNLASENVYEIENQGQTGVNVVECDSDFLNIPIEIIFNVHNKNANKGIATAASNDQSGRADEVPASQRESGIPKPARTSRGYNANVQNRSKKCVLCQRYVCNAKESRNFQPRKNSKPLSPNSLKSDWQSDESLDKGNRRAQECLLCGRDISRGKEGKTNKEAQSPLKSRSILDARRNNEKQPEKGKQTSDEEEPRIIDFPPLSTVHKVHSLSWENSDRLLVQETGLTLDKNNSLFQLRIKELFNEGSNISWENSDKVPGNDEGPTVDEEELPHIHFQPLTKETADVDKSDCLSEKSNKSLFFEPLIKASEDVEEPDLSRHESLSRDKLLAHPESIPFELLVRETVQEDPCLLLKISKTAIVDEEGITFTSVPKKDHPTGQFRGKIQDSTTSTSNQDVSRVLNRSPSISETEAAIRDKASTSSDLSDEFYFHFLKEEDIIIIEEEELPKKKGGVGSRLKSYFRRVRHRKTRIPVRSTTKTE